MEHPIPPDELVKQWRHQWWSVNPDCEGADLQRYIADQAAQWGADQELAACCEWAQSYAECGDALRLARRSKPPSLKEQALADLDTYIYGEPDPRDKERTYNTIRRALEQLPND